MLFQHSDPDTHHFPQRFETRSDFFTEELRLLPGRKVSTFVEFVVMDQFGLRPLCPAARGWKDLFRKDAHRNRDGDAFGIEIIELARFSQ